MKKTVLLGLTIFALGALFVAPGVSHAQCRGHASAQVVKTDAKAAPGCKPDCSQTCTAAERAACAASLGLSPEECQKYCHSDKYTMVRMSIEGMRGDDCEKALSSCLSGVCGVVKVGKIDRESKTAVIFVENGQFDEGALVKTVADKGYQARVIPAVARGEASPPAETAKATSGCSEEVRAACAAAGKKCPGTKKTDGPK